MKRTILAFLLSAIGFSLFSQASVLQKLDGLGIKNATVKDKPSPSISRMYLFDENKLKGAVIVFPLRELKLDVFAVIMQSGQSFTIQSIEAVDPKAFGAVMMGRIKTSLSKWDNMKESAIPDIISSATRYSRVQYSEIRDTVAIAFALLRNSNKK